MNPREERLIDRYATLGFGFMDGDRMASLFFFDFEGGSAMSRSHRRVKPFRLLLTLDALYVLQPSQGV